MPQPELVFEEENPKCPYCDEELAFIEFVNLASSPCELAVDGLRKTALRAYRCPRCKKLLALTEIS